jgi:hypothetical protein
MVGVWRQFGFGCAFGVVGHRFVHGDSLVGGFCAYSAGPESGPWVCAAAWARGCCLRALVGMVWLVSGFFAVAEFWFLLMEWIVGGFLRKLQYVI